MKEEVFWSVIEAARKKAKDIDGRVEALETQLQRLTPKEIEGFQKVYDAQVRRAFCWEIWGAAHVMNSGCTDDGFFYFCHWLISEGKERFEAALANPDSLVEVDRLDLFELEMFAYVASDVYGEKEGSDLERDHSLETAMPAGKSWKEDNLPFLYPNLSAKYFH